MRWINETFWRVIGWLMTFDNEPTDFDYDEPEVDPISQPNDN